MAEGYIKLTRCLLQKPIFQNEKLLKVWIWCLLKASHKEHVEIVGLQKITVKPGQFVFGRKVAAKELRLSASTVWRLMLFLQDNQSLDIKTNNKFSLVTVVNWAFYQLQQEKMDNKWTTNGQQMDNKWTTNGQQMDTNKNDKNDKNDNNNTSFLGNTDEKSGNKPYLPNDGNLLSAIKALTNRPLGPRDYQIIHGWIDDGVDSLIVIEAVKKAILKNADAPIIYADKIVIDWDKRGLKTIGAVLEFLKQEKKLTKREKNDLIRKELTETYDRCNGRQDDSAVSSKLSSLLKY